MISFLFVKSFQLYLFARVKSKEVVDNFNPALLWQYFEKNYPFQKPII